MNKFGQNGEQFYLAVIGDLRPSREDRERRHTQILLELALAEANRIHEVSVAAKFIITLGDEFQGLLLHPIQLFDIIERIELPLKGPSLRFGLGWGKLSTELKDQALGMDGPCFHHAREAMNEAKKTDEEIIVKGFGADQDMIINSFLSLMSAVKRRWKPAQAETVRLMRRYKKQKRVAAGRKVSTSVISEALKAAQFHKVMNAEAAVSKLMQLFAADIPSQPTGEPG